MAKYKRVLLKLSGEALAGPNKTGFDEATVLGIAQQVKKVSALGKEKKCQGWHQRRQA